MIFSFVNPSWAWLSAGWWITHAAIGRGRRLCRSSRPHPQKSFV